MIVKYLNYRIYKTEGSYGRFLKPHDFGSGDRVHTRSHRINNPGRNANNTLFQIA